MSSRPAANARSLLCAAAPSGPQPCRRQVNRRGAADNAGRIPFRAVVAAWSSLADLHVRRPAVARRSKLGTCRRSRSACPECRRRAGDRPCAQSRPSIRPTPFASSAAPLAAGDARRAPTSQYEAHPDQHRHRARLCCCCDPPAVDARNGSIGLWKEPGRRQAAHCAASLSRVDQRIARIPRA
jgi:hypothetical protein